MMIRHHIFPTAVRAGALVMLWLASGLAWAGPYVAPGDSVLRHDLKLLADEGVLNIPLGSWPMSWGDIGAALENADASSLSPVSSAALQRVRERMADDTETRLLRGQLRLAGSLNPRRIRTFEDDPREEGEAGAALEWTGERFALRLDASFVGDPDDEKRARADGSYAGLALGNWMLSAGYQEQWWGPGQQGSLILGNNARPVPGLLIRRNRSLKFKSRWLSWIGPWTVSVFAGQLEGERAVPDANLLGARVAFKPHRSLEIGLTRGVQWCGDSRPCGLESFWNMLIGNDNSGEKDSLGQDQEPGNQLGGIDLRYSFKLGSQPLAVYGQFIGEDEAGGLPSRYLGQLGLETWGAWGETGSFRLGLEYADTSCDFLESPPKFNCAYNNGIYQTGYRYRGRSLGHGMDNDGRMIALSGLLVDAEGHAWQLSLRLADLNRGGGPDARHSITPTASRYLDLEVSHTRRFSFGIIRLGLGAESFEDEQNGQRDTDERVFVEWRSR